MNIGIVTVYDAVDNVGSYLQAYALMYILKEERHNVFFIQNLPQNRMLCRIFSKLKPYRSLGLRIKTALIFFREWQLLPTRHKKDSRQMDLLIYGSDEIWNMDNTYFSNPFFFGSDVPEQPKVAYAISVGEMKEETLVQNFSIASGIKSFSHIAARDNYTRNLLQKHFFISGLEEGNRSVCDPTLLVPLDDLCKSCKVPRKNYLLVYTYGIDEPLISHIQQFAKEFNLLIVSVHFWHFWADEIMNVSPFHLPYLMSHASYVFSTTFHGSIFALRTHSRCAICPGRYKIRHLLRELNCQNRLVEKDCTYETFKTTILASFSSKEFELILEDWREYSLTKLKHMIKYYD